MAELLNNISECVYHFCSFKVSKKAWLYWKVVLCVLISFASLLAYLYLTDFTVLPPFFLLIEAITLVKNYSSYG